MGTPASRALHLALFLTGVVLYVVFVLPRWWVLTGDIPSTLATAGRIAAAFPIALAALPVMQILQKALRSKPPTPEIALRLRAWSAVLHVVAGVLILLAAIVEIWLSLEAGGPWLFAVYGAAGAIAILAVLALYLSFVAAKPPAGPKPVKPAKAKKVKAEKVKAAKTPRGKKRAANSMASATTTPDDAEAASSTTEPDTTVVIESTEADTTVVIESAEPDTATIVTESDSAREPLDAEPPSPALRNKRPAGKRRHRLGR